MHLNIIFCFWTHLDSFSLLWTHFRDTRGNQCSKFPIPWYSIFSFMCMFCRSLFVLLYFFFWPLSNLFFFDIQILITSLWYLQTLLILYHKVNSPCFIYIVDFLYGDQYYTKTTCFHILLTMA
jgi:hypothetical protein